MRPVDIGTAMKRLLRSANAGLPYLTRKGAVLEAIGRAHGRGEYGEWPAVCFTRTEAGEKTRNVWGYPGVDTLEEQRYFVPWLGVEKMFAFRSALHDPDRVDTSITRLLRGKRGSEVVQCIDFSGFDSTVHPELAVRAFDVIGSYFQDVATPDLERIVDRFVTIPIVTPVGVYSGVHGVPSGSTWTNSIDSLVQFLVSGHSALKCQIQGDDGVYVIEETKMADFADRWARFGFVVSDDKTRTFSDQEAVYLQRYYHPSYPTRRWDAGRLVRDDSTLGGVYSLHRALGRLVYPDVWTNTKQEGISGRDYWSLRSIAILEGCKHHPAFAAFVKLVRDWDKHGLEFGQSGLRAYSRLQEARVRAGSAYGMDREAGLGLFSTVQILKGME